ERPEDLHRLRNGPSPVVDEEHLLLRADPADLRLDEPPLEHRLERPEIAQEPPHELAMVLARQIGRDVLDSHGFPRRSSYYSTFRSAQAAEAARELLC